MELKTKKIITSSNDNEESSVLPANHYVDNKKFYQALVEQHRLRREALDAGRIPPPLSNYIGECFLKIASRIVTRWNFRNYSYKEDMVSESVENCIKYWHNFDVTKYKNPFGYFTLVVLRCCVRFIKQEKKQTRIRSAIVKNADVIGIISELQESDDGSYNNSLLDYWKQFVDDSDKADEKGNENIPENYYTYSKKRPTVETTKKDTE